MLLLLLWRRELSIMALLRLKECHNESR